MPADPVTALIQILLQSSDIVLIAEDRVFGIELPREEARNQPRGAIIVRPAGGASATGGYLEHTNARFDIICIGETPHSAFQLSTLVKAHLRRVRRQAVQTGDVSVLVHSLEEAGGQISTRDPQTQWPMASQSFQLFYAIKEVA